MTSPQDELGARRARLVLVGLVVAVVLGVLPKAVWWLSRGDLWCDEAALAMNIGPRSLFDIGRPFTHLQVGPYAVLITMKLFTMVFGESEVAYRALPFFFSVVTLLLAWPLGVNLGGRFVGLLSVLLLGASHSLTYMAGETKPYAADALFAALLTLCAFRVLDAPEDRRRWTTLVVLGVLGAWSSLPALFVLGGIGAALLLESIQQRRGWKGLSRVVLVGALWIAAFTVHYNTFLARSDIANDPGVVAYFQTSLAPFPPRSLVELRWYLSKTFFFFEAPLGLTPRYLWALLFGVAFVIILRSGRHLKACAVLVPGVLAVIASGLGKYPVVGRHVLFLVPGFVLVLAVGLVWVFERGRVIGTMGLLVSMPLIAQGYVRSWGEALQTSTDLRFAPVSRYHAEHRKPGDVLVLVASCWHHVWDFYVGRSGGPNARYLHIPDLREPINADDFEQHPQLPPFAEKTFGEHRVWIVAENEPTNPPPTTRSWEYSSRDFTQRYLLRAGARRLEGVDAQGVSLDLYDLTNAVAPTGADRLRNPID